MLGIILISGLVYGHLPNTLFQRKEQTYMPKRGENIHKRKDGRWEGRYKKGVDFNNKTKYGSVYGKTYREVKTKLQAKQNMTLHSPELKSDKSLFRDAAVLWVENSRIRLKGATENKYRNLIDSHIIPDLGDVRLDHLCGTNINTYLANKLESGRLDGKGGLSPSYVKSIMLVINSIMTFAVENKMCQPLNTKISKPQVESAKPAILTEEDQKAIEAICLKETDATKAGVLLSLYTGMRIGEVCALEWTDLDFKRKVIHVRKTVSRVRNSSPDAASRSMLVIDSPKTKSSCRDIPLSSWLIPVLEQVRITGVSKYVTSTNSEFISPRTYDYRYHKLLSDAGISAVNYHALRHTFATRCIKSGMDVKSLSEVLGHADASVTLNIYVHSSLEHKRLQLEKIRPY